MTRYSRVGFDIVKSILVMVFIGIGLGLVFKSFLDFNEIVDVSSGSVFVVTVCIFFVVAVCGVVFDRR